MWESFIESYGDPVFEEFDMTALKVDESYLKFSSSLEGNISVYQKSSLCYRCPFKKMMTLQGGDNQTLKYDTNPYWSFVFSSSEEDFFKYPGRSEEELCSFESQSLGEFGVYEMSVNPSYCDFRILKEPVFIYGGLILGILFYLLLALIYGLINWIRSQPSEIPEKHQIPVIIENGRGVPYNVRGRPEGIRAPQKESSGPKKPRLRSLDTFRGITIVLMILVNYGGGKYWFLEHAPWNGLRLADVIFPWFLWIMGVCIPMGIKSQLKKKIPKMKIFRRIIIRSLKLFALGLILNTVGGHNQLEKIRIPGVLQRFAISYFFTSSVYLLCGSPFINDSVDGVAKSMGDVVLLFPQWVIYILLMVGYGAFIFFMPNPGCPTGYQGPGGIVLLQNGQPSPDCIGGVTRMVDIWLLGSSHIFQYPSAKSIYETSSFDPEGVLGSVPTFLQVFLGIQAGQTLQNFTTHGARLKRWLIWGVGTFVAALALSSGIFIGGPIPVNKNLWSLSYVFLTSSTAFLLLSLCYVLVDCWKIWKGSPFRQTGMNSIFLYVAHFFTYNVFPWRFRYGRMNSHLALFAEALFGTTLWILIALYLYKKNKFYTI